MRNPFIKGDIVVSKAGHDANRAYVVVSDEIDGFVWLADGEYRQIGKQKRKRTKHLRFVAKSGLNLDALNDEQLNTGIKTLLKKITKREVEENAQRR